MDGVTGTFDALGRRAELGSSFSYSQMVYLPSDPMRPVGAASALSITSTGLRMPIPGGGKVVYSSSGLSQYWHPNWQGSQVLASNPTQTTPTVGGAFSPFGEKYASYSGGSIGYFAENTGIADGGPISDAYQAAARLYHQSQGRWISPDPAGMGAVDLTDPQTLNRYAYVANNPLSFTDPSGLGPDTPADTTIEVRDSVLPVPYYWLLFLRDFFMWRAADAKDSRPGGPSTGGAGKTTPVPKTGTPAPSKGRFKNFASCVADGVNKASLAALLPQNAPPLLENLASNDFATLQSLIFGPNRASAAVSVAQGRGANAIAQGIGAIPYGADRFILATNGAGTTYARDMIIGKIANSAFGVLIADLSAAKAAYDAGSYVAGFGTCAIWGK